VSYDDPLAPLPGTRFPRPSRAGPTAPGAAVAGIAAPYGPATPARARVATSDPAPWPRGRWGGGTWVEQRDQPVAHRLGWAPEQGGSDRASRRPGGGERSAPRARLGCVACGAVGGASAARRCLLTTNYR
jgi:hypothetical protein